MIGNRKEFFLELSCRVKYYRQKRDMSQQELGKLIRCSVKEIKMLECDGVTEKICGEAWGNKRMKFIFKIANALKIDPSIFIVPMSDQSFERYRTDKNKISN